MYFLQYFKLRILSWIRHVKNLYFNQLVKSNIKRFKNSKNKKDEITIAREMNELKEYWGETPLQYITHDFYDKNCTLSIQEMKEYIPGYFFYYVIYPKFDNIKKVSALVEDKFNTYFLFKKLDYKVPNPIFLKEKGCYDPLTSKYLDSEQLLSWLAKTESSKVFIKPVKGRGGEGIIIAHRFKGEFSIDNSPLNLNFLNSLNGNYIIEPGIIQSAYVSSVYPESVNTLRVVTKRDLSSKKVSIVAITLRMGRSGNEVDNSMRGGLLMGLNIETGHPINGYATHHYGSQRFYNHPDTGYKFADFYMRDWASFKSEILRIANSMKEINLAGWDIAITDDGPVVIETNIQFGLDHSQSGVGGLKKHFIKGNPEAFLRGSHEA